MIIYYYFMRDLENKPWSLELELRYRSRWLYLKKLHIREAWRQPIFINLILGCECCLKISSLEFYFFNFRLDTNLPKNRYNNILAFEETRVRLQELEDDPVRQPFFICYFVFEWSLVLVINISCVIWGYSVVLWEKFCRR